MNSNSTDPLVQYGDEVDSEIQASAVTRAEQEDAHDRLCAVTTKKLPCEAVVLDAINSAK